MPNRSGFVAVMLSIVCTGLGHVYCHRLKQGITFFLLSLSFGPVVFLLAEAPPSTPALVTLIAAVLGIVGLYGYAVIDAWRLARRSAGDLERLPVIRWGGVYALFLFVGAFYPVAAAVAIRSHALEVYQMGGDSMAPTLLEGDRIVVNKRSFRGMPPRRGDVVAFRAPGDRDRVWVKRVIALPGDTVAVRGGRVVVNERPLPGTTPIAQSSSARTTDDCCTVAIEESDGRRYEIIAPVEVEDFPPTKVPQHACFVLGDHRDCSRDSRHFRTIPLTDIIGEAQYVLFPQRRWARFGSCRATR